MVAPLVLYGAAAAGATAMGLLFNDCEGKAADDTRVKFHRTADLTQEQKEALVNRIRDFERLIRSFNPDLFHMFKGWKVASPEGVDRLHLGFELISDPHAYYNSFVNGL